MSNDSGKLLYTGPFSTIGGRLPSEFTWPWSPQQLIDNDPG